MSALDDLATSRRLAGNVASLAEALVRFQDNAEYCWSFAEPSDICPTGPANLEQMVREYCARVEAQAAGTTVPQSVDNLVAAVAAARSVFQSHWMNSEHRKWIEWRQRVEHDEPIGFSLRRAMLQESLLTSQAMTASNEPVGCPFHKQAWTFIRTAVDELSDLLPGSQRECFQLANTLSDVVWPHGSELSIGGLVRPAERSFGSWFESEVIPTISGMLLKVTRGFSELEELTADLSTVSSTDRPTPLLPIDESSAVQWAKALLGNIHARLRQANAEQRELPSWDSAQGKLKLGRLEIELGQKATNLRLIFDVFQRLGWPQCADVRLPLAKPESKQKLGHRLCDARKALNKLMKRSGFPICFEAGDKSGQVCWKRVTPATP